MYQSDPVTVHVGKRLSPWQKLMALSLRIFRMLCRWRQLAAERRELRQLDATILKDIGISRAEALREASRPFWDDPLYPRSSEDSKERR